MSENHKTILLVEDNPDDEALTIRALQRSHISNEIVVAHDGVEALDYLFGIGIYAERDISVKPTVILLDLKLPRVDGIEVLRRLREDERTKLLPVVVLTTSNEEQDMLDSYSLGCNSYIRKPVDFLQFSEAIRQLGMYWLLINEPPPDLKEQGAGRMEQGENQ
ncbi:two-component system response regulator [Scytonema hofmannii PCC 7110]|uniref:Two-component system response regulator n=1 Tax=Scytonema hofmannii PCC 7110 TaxID=128403 RepID=A0A139XEN2_9CYAN|nr:response regulator [Scytonema hofmannii]KYC43148.1 two-component system response regulator [Scytonema hofmannii PCC 7110]